MDCGGACGGGDGVNLFFVVVCIFAGFGFPLNRHPNSNLTVDR